MPSVWEIKKSTFQEQLILTWPCRMEGCGIQAPDIQKELRVVMGRKGSNDFESGHPINPS